MKYHQIKVVLLFIGSLFLAPVTFSASEDQHQGIDITVNINDANVEQLQLLLVGIGPDKAKSIIEYRTANGKFAAIDDLAKVKGIGASTVEKNRNRIKL